MIELANTEVKAAGQFLPREQLPKLDIGSGQ